LLGLVSRRQDVRDKRDVRPGLAHTDTNSFNT
jgi:hypothetical protein